MALCITDFEHLLAAWPSPVLLSHLEGDTFATLLQRDRYIETIWSGHITADDVVTASKVYLALLQLNPCPKLLNNKADVTGDWSEANDWLEFEWLPQVMSAGLQCLAHVYSDNMFSRLSARDLQQRVEPTLRMQNFSERQAAEKWLLECPLG